MYFTTKDNKDILDELWDRVPIPHRAREVTGLEKPGCLTPQFRRSLLLECLMEEQVLLVLCLFHGLSPCWF